jgi:hypothetical protein
MNFNTRSVLAGIANLLALVVVVGVVSNSLGSNEAAIAEPAIANMGKANVMPQRELRAKGKGADCISPTAAPSAKGSKGGPGKAGKGNSEAPSTSNAPSVDESGAPSADSSGAPVRISSPCARASGILYLSPIHPLTHFFLSMPVQSFYCSEAPSMVPSMSSELPSATPSFTPAPTKGKGSRR